MRWLIHSPSVLCLTLLVSAPAALAQQFDPAPAWPLCGRIVETMPPGWVEADGCPVGRWGNPDHTDLPLASPFGPRPLVSEDDRFDFHRGIDIAADEWTPVFAIADGDVKIAGDHSSYSDPLVQIRHYRPGHSSCADVGCYHTNYMHLSAAAVAVDQVVAKGELIGYTGRSASGFAHLHFEVRDAPPIDIYSRWQREAINPLGVLPYQSTAVPTITFDAVDSTDPNNPIVQLSVQSARPDVNRVELSLYDAAGGLIPQPGDVADARGYNVHPSFYDFDEWNYQYTHKNSTNFPWESFGEGGANQCPYFADHGSSYDANVHMDAQHPDDFHVGLFNGVEIRPTRYVAGDYNLTVTFRELQGTASCVVARVSLAAGGETSAQWGSCGTTVPPIADDQAAATDEDTAVDITLTGAVGDGDSLSFQITQQPSFGALSGTPPTMTYTPDPNYNGPDGFAFVANDGLSISAPGTVSIMVAPVNDPPVADGQSVTTNKDTPVAIILSGSDPDGDPLSFAVTAGPSNGTLSGTGASLTYTPDPGYNGADGFDFQADDGQGGTDTATVSINVKKGKGGGGGGGGGGNGGGKPPKNNK